MKIRNSASIMILLVFLLNVENVSGGSTRGTPCFKICEGILTKLALEDPKIAIEEAIKEWFLHKKECEGTCEYEMYLAELYCNKGDYKKCRSMSEEVIAKKGKTCDVRVAERTLVSVDLQERDFQSVKVRSEAMMKKYPDWCEGYYFYGLLLFHDDKILEAIKYFEKANALEELAYTYGWLAISYYLEYHDYEKTLKLYEKALDLSQGVLRIRSQTLAAIDSAMYLNNWDLAKKLLNYQEKADPSIVDDEDYQTLRLRMDDYIKTHSSE